jgi:hypothetical protein
MDDDTLRDEEEETEAAPLADLDLGDEDEVADDEEDEKLDDLGMHVEGEEEDSI